MKQFKIDDDVVLNDNSLKDIILTHLSFMKALGSDEDIEYTVALAESKAEAACFSIPDNVNITGNYLEATYIDDNNVTVAIMEKEYATDCILSCIDTAS